MRINLLSLLTSHRWVKSAPFRGLQKQDTCIITLCKVCSEIQSSVKMCIRLVVFIALSNLCIHCCPGKHLNEDSPVSKKHPLVVEHGPAVICKWLGRIGCSSTIRVKKIVIDFYWMWNTPAARFRDKISSCINIFTPPSSVFPHEHLLQHCRHQNIWWTPQGGSKYFTNIKRLCRVCHPSVLSVSVN